MNDITPIDEEYIYGERAIISQTDANGIITFVNRQFCKVSGYNSSEIVGQSHSLLRHPDMPDIVFENMYKTIQSGQVWSGVIKNLRKDGTYFWVEEEILPIYNDNNEITGYIATARLPSRENIEENKEMYRKMVEGK